VAFSQHNSGSIYDNAVVVDNSVCMRWLFDDGSASDKRYAKNVIEKIEENSSTTLVPYLWVHEAAFVVDFYANTESIERETCMQQLDSLFALHTVVISRVEPSEIFTFSQQYKISAYDAAYLMLALEQKCPIATLDKKMIKVAKILDLKRF